MKAERKCYHWTIKYAKGAKREYCKNEVTHKCTINFKYVCYDHYMANHYTCAVETKLETV